MPYKRTAELPERVRNVLPPHARRIYLEAFNNAWKEYEDPKQRRGDAGQEEVAHRVAWSAVKQIYQKEPDNKWHIKR